MTTTHKTTKSTHSHAHPSPETTTSPTPEPTAAPAPAAAAAPASSSPSTSSAIFLAPPPSTANIPVPPAGFVPATGSVFLGTQPTKSELVALPGAIDDLKKFSNLVQVLGSVAPPPDELLPVFVVVNAWSVMRNASALWDEYAREQSATGWKTMRLLIARLKPAFDLAASSDPSLYVKYPNLAKLLGDKSVSAKKAVATKKKDKQSKAAGKPALHGETGKQQEHVLEKDALAQLTASQEPSPANAPPPTTPVAQPAPANGVAHS